MADSGDAEGLLQEVLYELTLAYRLPEPIERIGAWLFRVARNRIGDLFRKKRPALLAYVLGSDHQDMSLDDLPPPADARMPT